MVKIISVPFWPKFTKQFEAWLRSQSHETVFSSNTYWDIAGLSFQHRIQSYKAFSILRVFAKAHLHIKYLFHIFMSQFAFYQT